MTVPFHPALMEEAVWTNSMVSDVNVQLDLVDTIVKVWLRLSVVQKIILIDVDKFNDHNKQSFRMFTTNTMWKIFQIYLFFFKKSDNS